MTDDDVVPPPPPLRLLPLYCACEVHDAGVGRSEIGVMTKSDVKGMTCVPDWWCWW